jgi:hypothetical protein
MQKHYIYGLFSGDPKEYFYVGRSISMSRRLREHIYESKAGTEAKYQFIRALDACGIEWKMELIAEVNETDEHFEDFYVYDMICKGHPLQNQKMGDAIDAAKHDAMRNLREKRAIYADAPTFLTALAREIAEEKARKQAERLRDKVRNKTTRTGYGESISAVDFERTYTKISPALQAIMDRRKK